MEIVVKDGVRYLPHRYKDETELENLVRMHVKFIFGNNSLFFEKTKIKSRTDIGSIPDGFVLLPPQERWYIVEVELSQHPPHKHLVPQLSKFHSAIKNPVTRNKLIDAFYEEINKNPDLLNYIYKTTGGKKELYKLLTDIINKDPEFVIIIDEKTSELEEACKSLSFKPRVIEFKTYLREGSNVPIYIFDVIEEKKEREVDLVVVPKGTNFTGKCPKAVKFKDQTFEVNSWRKVAKVTLKNVVEEVDDFSRAEEIKGSKKIYFSTNKNDVVHPIDIPNSSYYFMGNASANMFIKILSRLLNKFNYGKDEVILILKE